MDFRAPIMMRFLKITFVLLVLPVSARAQVAPQWKLALNAEWKSERAFSQKQIVETKVRQFTQESTSRWLVHLRVIEKKADAAFVSAMLEKVEHKVKGRIGKEGLDHLLAEKMQGTEFKFLVGARGVIRDLSGYDELVRKVAGDDMEKQRAFRGSFPLSGLAEALQDLFGVLPENQVKIGDSWERLSDDPIPFFGSLQTKATFRLEKVDQAIAQIGISLASRYVPPKRGEDLFRVV